MLQLEANHTENDKSHTETPEERLAQSENYRITHSGDAISLHWLGVCCDPSVEMQAMLNWTSGVVFEKYVK